jgi:predicted nucleic acid-binding Zn ribbon protein
MTSDPQAAPPSGGLLAPRPGAEPESHCVRCGRPTPAGVALCEVDNPGHIKAPSATQVHGTMLLGVGIGVLGFLLIARLAVGHAGPFVGSVTGQASQAGGGVAVVLHVVNQGSEAAFATCRVTRDGSPRPDDVVFRTSKIPAGGSDDEARILPAAQIGQPAYQIDRVTVACT